MEECYACGKEKGKFGQCVEYQLFEDQAQYDAYYTYDWFHSRPDLVTKWKESKSSVGVKVISKEEWEKGAHGKNCVEIEAAPVDTKVDTKVYAVATIKFGSDGAKEMQYKVRAPTPRL